MNEQLFFFDTYAFFEIIRGNPLYEKYKNVPAITSIFNLAELNYNLKKELKEEQADYYTNEYAPFLVEVDLETLKKAMSFKKKYKSFSIPDAIGYHLALKMNAMFLTGDEGFRHFPNVEFVKK